MELHHCSFRDSTGEHQNDELLGQGQLKYKEKNVCYASGRHIHWPTSHENKLFVSRDSFVEVGCIVKHVAVIGSWRRQQSAMAELETTVLLK